MANYKQKLEFRILTTEVFFYALSYSFVVVLLTTPGKCVGSSVTVTQRFYYSAYPVLGCYSQFHLLDISR